MAPLIILLTSVILVDAGPLIISRPGSDVSINCPCVKTEGCVGDYMRWARFDTNGTVEVIDTDCQKPPCRFSNKKLNDFEIQPMILLVEERDSGRYYCGDKLSTRIYFNPGDTLLQVGEEESWTKNSEVVLLSEWFNDSLQDHRTKPKRYAELRCLVTGLGAPVSDILWRSSAGKNRTGQILESVKTSSGFQVMSQQQVPIPTSYPFYYSNGDNSHNALQHEESDKDLEEEEWWCELHTGDNKTHISNNFSLNKRNREESVSGWCITLSYAAIALSTVSVILLLILISHWLCYLHTDHTNKGSVTLI